MTETEQFIPDVFIFCWCPESWVPRAIITNISKFDDEAKEQMEIILKVGTIVEKLWEQIDDDSNYLKLKGVRAFNTNTIINDDKIILTLNTWQQLADSHHMRIDDPNHWIHFSEYYYINDVNSNLSPIDLYEKLTSLTCHPKNPEFKFKVKYCVLVSDLPLPLTSKQTVKALRFFYETNEQITQDEVKNRLKLYFDVKNVIIADTGYGFLTPKHIKQWSELNNGKFKLDGIMVIFE